MFFNSRFESGNLREVEKINDLEYNLYLNFDFNTLNYTQWYYFSVRNVKKGIFSLVLLLFRFHLQIQHNEPAKRRLLLLPRHEALPLLAADPARLRPGLGQGRRQHPVPEEQSED